MILRVLTSYRLKEASIRTVVLAILSLREIVVMNILVLSNCEITKITVHSNCRYAFCLGSLSSDRETELVLGQREKAYLDSWLRDDP